tara:strand:+ start:99 stop:461 length:363 start_codon:yes stop_codon:yes gene_type:complete
MIITRIYTGKDNQSHIEDLEVPEKSVPNTLQAVSSITFRSHEPGRFSDWHCESKRNYIITLSGEGEIGLGDGSIHKIGPGRVMLVEDLTGQGHTTRVSSTIPRITVAIPLTNQSPGDISN